jgi:hypothetical protein
VKIEKKQKTQFKKKFTFDRDGVENDPICKDVWRPEMELKVVKKMENLLQPVQRAHNPDESRSR